NTYGQRVAAACEAAAAGERALVYVYDGDLDYTGHQHGCRSAAWRHQLTMTDSFAEQLFDHLPGGTALLVTGDHGMVDVDAERRIDVDDVPAPRGGVELGAGGARARRGCTTAGGGGDGVAAWRAPPPGRPEGA